MGLEQGSANYYVQGQVVHILEFGSPNCHNYSTLTCNVKSSQTTHKRMRLAAFQLNFVYKSRQWAGSGLLVGHSLSVPSLDFGLLRLAT